MAAAHSRRLDCVVYGLYDPRSGELRYVGQTSQGLRTRLAGHLRDARRREHTRIARWLHALMALGVKPQPQILESTLYPEMLGTLEQKWIAWAKERTSNLTNLTDGGDGGLLGWKPSAETLEKFRRRPNAWLGRKHSPESITKMRAAQVRGWTPAKSLNIAESNRRRKGTASAEARLALAEGSRRVWADPIRRTEMRAARAINVRVREGHARQAAAMRGRKRSPESIAATARSFLKPVIDDLGTVYPSVSAAAAALGVTPQAISHVVYGRTRRVRGRSFSLHSRPETAA